MPSCCGIMYHWGPPTRRRRRETRIHPKIRRGTIT